ncbi:MAG: aminotransferase class IV [Chloroflexi bacterium]|nr:aminotransferase class IV [Chloroflexota bacterium]
MREATRMMTAWLDGRLVDAEAPALALGDRGFQLGDGVFETLRVRRSIAVDLAIHLRRLRDGLAALAIPMPFDDGELAAAIAAVVTATAPADASVRITVSRGVLAGRGTLPRGWQEARPTVAIQAWPFVPAPAGLLRRGVVAITATGRRDPAAPLASVKTISRADHVQAKLEAERAGADEAITLTLGGEVAEATSANLAIVTAAGRPAGRRLLTPPLSAGILDGTTRDWLLGPEGAAALGLPPDEALFGPEDLLAADEALLCSSVAGILPLVRLDGSAIGDGRPGPWARRLRAAREAWIVAASGG